MGDPENPDPPPEPEPVPVSDDPLVNSGVAQMDAPLDVRQTFYRATVGASVRRPGQAEVVGSGARAVVDGAHNWVPIGPRNVGGRVRAIAINPDHRQIMYAAPAAGGVYKSLDGAESWFPLWHDEPSLSLGALAICPAHTEVIWAGTGETEAGGGETIPGAGVLRSINGGRTWTAPGEHQDIRGARVHALAAHPNDQDRCWAATDIGLFRTIDGGATWTQFLANRPVTDVLHATIGGNLRLFAVLSGFGVEPGPPVVHHPLVIRIDQPDHSDVPNQPASAALSAALPGTPAGTPVDTTVNDPLLPLAGTFPAPTGTNEPADGKLALYPGGAPGFPDPVLYVVYADDSRSYFGHFRCGNLDAATPADLNWTRIPSPAVFQDEGQGTYNLCLAVSPLNPNQIAFGMVELYLHENANANNATAAQWKRAQMWDLFMIERGHHADHHFLVFAERPDPPFDGGLAAGTIVLWDASDGGVTACSNWPGSTSYPIGTGTTLPAATLPLDPGVPIWRKRSHGISATQMYDLTQHPRLPTVLGCGFQDNGAFLATGGPSWQMLLAADGGFVAFDPDDPYRLLVTWQSGVAESRFPGVLHDALPLLGEGVQAGLWPRELSDGFLQRDQALFVADTLFHPTRPGRVFIGRRNRVYGTRLTNGDRWIPEPVGHGIEIVHRPTTANPSRSHIEVSDTPGARALGFYPQQATTLLGEDPRVVSRLRSLAGQPFTIPNGQELVLTFASDTTSTPAIHVPLTVGGDLPAQATAGQLAAYLRREIRSRLPAANTPDVDVLSVFWPLSTELYVVSTGAGSGETIHVESSSPATFSVVARDYRGAAAGAGGPALPAIVPLDFGSDPNRRLVMAPGGIDVTGMTLRFEREGHTAVVNINDADFPDSRHVFPADFAEVLRNKLPSASYTVVTCPIGWGIRLTSTAPAANLTLSGNLVADLMLEPGATGRSVRITNRSEFDLRQTGTPAADRTLRVAEAGHQTANQALTTAFLGVTDLRRVTSVELCDALRRMIDTAGNVRVRCDLDLHPLHTPNTWRFSIEGEPSELAFGPPGSRRMWVGDTAGRLYRSRDDGESWAEVDSQFTQRCGAVEAIAVKPDDPRHVVAGAYLEGAQPAVHMLRWSDSEGDVWHEPATPIEDANHAGVGIRALEFDPAAPTNVYAATDLGVYRSTDGGDNWERFNEGLPNVRISDLAFEPTTRMLRAGAWGRGVYERHVGTRDAKNVRLYIRSTALDDGSAQPYPGPDLSAVTSTALRLDASPDIKQLRRDPRRGFLLDGVEFDEEVGTTDVRIGPAFIAVQVHNRGGFPTESARVAVLWAPADNGPPPVPDEIRTPFAALDPVAVGTRFGDWTVIADGELPDPQHIGHNIVAPGYPRVAIVGTAPAFEWHDTDLDGRTRIGLLALTRCEQDKLEIGTNDVLELVRGEPKAAYRECPIVAGAADALTVIRVTRGTGFRVEAPTGGLTDAANGAAPFGLAATAGAVLEARFTTPEPYDLSAGDVGFQLTFAHPDVNVQFVAGEPSFRNIASTNSAEVAAVVNRQLVAADVPVRATNMEFPPGVNDALRIRALRTSQFTIDGTAGLLGVNTGAATNDITTPFASRGPWDLTPPGAGPRQLQLHVTTTAEIRLGPQTPEFRTPAAVSAAELRAAINRLLRQNGITTVVAEPLVVALSVRRSSTEAVGARAVTGGYAVADIVGSKDPIAPDDRPERFRALAAQDADLLTAGQTNHLYVRVANVGTVRVDPGRVRLFELTVPSGPGPVTRSDPAFGSVEQPLSPGESAIVDVPFDLDARPSAARVFILAVADLAATPLDPPADRPSLDEWHRFSLEHPQVAIRELVVA